MPGGADPLQPQWNELDPKIITQNGPGPHVTVNPDAIPDDATLLLVASTSSPADSTPFTINPREYTAKAGRDGKRQAP